MHNLEISTIAIFSAQYKNIEEAENAGALYSVDIEYPMTLNDLSLLCESVAKPVWLFDEVEDADLVLLSGNPFIKRWLHKEILKIRRLTYTRLDEELEKIAHYPDSLRHSSVRAHRLSLIAGTKTD